MWLRYEQTTVPLGEVIERVVGKQRLENGDLVGISPDTLMMMVYEFIKGTLVFSREATYAL
jgi:hypothetical protein